MNAISPLAVAAKKSKKPRMLVVDDEPDNLDLLYRTFRRDYHVLRAESGIEALKVLSTEGEVAVIISDQRMPEMKGTEFLSKTVPEFPDTVRIILTGFTDVEDLVEAINAGQVYRYITKPWDPEELKVVVQKAAESYDILKQRTEELFVAEKQSKLMATVGQVAAQKVSLDDALQLIAQGFGQILDAEICTLSWLEADKLTTTGSYGSAPSLDALSQSALVQRAITTQALQMVADIGTDAELAGAEFYQTTQTQSHMAVPIVYQGTLMGVLSLQWQSAYNTLEDVGQMMNLLCFQMALAMAALED
jgi:CheY-like chemotaxis protein